VKRRLERESLRHHPKPTLVGIVDFLAKAVWVTPVVALLLATSLAFDRFNEGAWSGEIAWAFALGVGVALPSLGVALVVRLLRAGTRSARSSWQGNVNTMLYALAMRRQETIEERNAFYSSSEWRQMRQEVIAEDGANCNGCGRQIAEAIDVTVDHRRPRSRYPELALERSNLQVLCRACNSRKGARDEFASP